MNTLRAYRIKVYDKKLSGKSSAKFSDLANIRGVNLIGVIQATLLAYSNSYYTPTGSSTSKAVRFKKVKRNGNAVTALSEVGEFGIEGPINNVKTGKTSHVKKQDESDIFTLYFAAQIWPGSTEGVLVFHYVGVRGIKGILQELLDAKLKASTNGLTTKIEPISCEKTLKDWFDTAEVKKLYFERYDGGNSSDAASRELGDYTSQLIYRPTRKQKTFGLLREVKRKAKNDLITIPDGGYTEISAEAELNGRKRKFILTSNELPSSSVVIDDDVEFSKGNPVVTSISKYTFDFIEDIKSEMKP